VALPGVLPAERLWLRAAALGIDLVILAGGPLLAATVLTFLVVAALPDPPYSTVAFRVAQVVALVLFLFRDALGASPGKMILGLKVVRKAGGRISPLSSLVRNVPLLVPGWNVVEAVVVLRRADARRPGDRAAGTRVLEV
jgi:uncharacterized RDD family membrane protein YckC